MTRTITEADEVKLKAYLQEQILARTKTMENPAWQDIPHIQIWNYWYRFYAENYHDLDWVGESLTQSKGSLRKNMNTYEDFMPLARTKEYEEEGWLLQGRKQFYEELLVFLDTL